MFTWFCSLNFQMQALIACIFTWLFTMVGCFIVLFFKNINEKLMRLIFAITGGMMMASAIFSLLIPALEFNISNNYIIALGILAGSLFLILIELIYTKVSSNHKNKRSMKLLIAMTLHNIPEGFAVSICFSALATTISNMDLKGAIVLTIAMALQNIPDGIAVCLPLKADGFTNKKALLYGFLTSIVEPISGIIGIYISSKINNIIPFLLALASGTILYVIITEFIPASQNNEQSQIINALVTILGFLLIFIIG